MPLKHNLTISKLKSCPFIAALCYIYFVQIARDKAETLKKRSERNLDGKLKINNLELVFLTINARRWFGISQIVSVLFSHRPRLALCSVDVVFHRLLYLITIPEMKQNRFRIQQITGIHINNSG